MCETNYTTEYRKGQHVTDEKCHKIAAQKRLQPMLFYRLFQKHVVIVEYGSAVGYCLPGFFNYTQVLGVLRVA